VAVSLYLTRLQAWFEDRAAARLWAPVRIFRVGEIQPPERNVWRSTSHRHNTAHSWTVTRCKLKGARFTKSICSKKFWAVYQPKASTYICVQVPAHNRFI